MKHLFNTPRGRRAFVLRRTRPLCLEPLEERTLLSTFFVVNAGDTGAGHANYGDLRYCITQANCTLGANVIQFALSTTPPGTNAANSALFGAAVQTIHLHSALPALTNSVTLDGWSQGGAGYTGAPLIELDGREVAHGSGLVIEASNCVVRGLAVNNFGAYGLVVAAGSANDWVYGCSFGVALDGLHAANSAGGVYLGGINTLLGTNADGVHDAAERNLISGNNGYGVIVAGAGNTIAGNFIGLGADGSTALGNTGAGVLVLGACNTIGGATDGAGNVISANIGSGILIAGASAMGNVVRGNLIGTDASGMSARGNLGDGVVVTDEASGNVIGGSAAGERNVISGNHAAGVALGRFTDAGAGNRVLGNYIGVNADGTAALGNRFEGVLINDRSDSEVIGGSDPGEGNVISGNGLFGLNIINATNNTVQGNLIGVLPDGVTAAPNALGGVVLQFTFLTTTGNLIGGTTAGAGNVIAGNTGPGVLLAGADVIGNVIAGNLIGTTAAGAPLGNTGDGVRLESGASKNTIGGEAPGAGNVIAFNAKGVVVAGDDSTGDTILGNSIFGNAGLGIDLGDDGVTPNGTPPPGPDNFQPHPILLSAANGQVAGFFNAAADATYRIELFAGPASGPAGQGQTFLGSILVTAGANGFASFSTVLAIPAGDVVTATATNIATGDTSEFSDPPPADLPPTVALANLGGLMVMDTGQSASFSGFFADPDSTHWTATINYGDGSGAQPLVLTPDHTFAFNHVYQQEGNYLVTVAITDDGGASGFASVPIIVFDSSIPLGQVGEATAPPGGSATITGRGITATLDRDASDDPTQPAFLLTGPVPESKIAQLGGSSVVAPGMHASAFDIRSVNLTAQDKAVVTFQYPPGMGTPALQYFDAASHSFKPVQADSIVIDSVHGTITLTFDAGSTPRLGDLTGTVFLVSIPQGGVSSPAPAPPPAPVPPPLSPPAGAPSATATSETTTTSTPFLATSLPSSSSNSSALSGNAQTTSNNSSANGISAFSPFFVLIITAARPGMSGGEAEAGAGAEASASTAPAPNVPSLLDRLPRAPVSEDNFTPLDSEPNAVLSPSRAGLPEGVDKPNPPPAPIPPPAANHLPPLGFHFRPAGLEAVNEREMPAAFESDTEEGMAWFDGVLTEILGRVARRDSGRAEQESAVHPAIAVLALGTGLAFPTVRRTSATRMGKRLFEEIAE
jgi:hypothetical protein